MPPTKRAKSITREYIIGVLGHGGWWKLHLIAEKMEADERPGLHFSCPEGLDQFEVDCLLNYREALL